MKIFSLIIFVAVFVLALVGGRAHALQADVVAPAPSLKGRLISKLRAMRPDTLVTFAQTAIDKMATPEGRALHARVRASAMNCATCEQNVGIIMAVAADEQLLNQTEIILKDYCAAKYVDDATKADECKLAVDVVGFALPKLFKALSGLAWDVPFNLCAILFDNICTQKCCGSDYAPEQVYISLDDSSDFSRMRVTWVTLLEASDANVQYFTAGGAMQMAAAEPSRTYAFGGWIGVVNTAVMTGLSPNTRYNYTVGSSFNHSQTFSFKTFPANIGTPERPLRIINIADMAYDNNSDWTVVRVGVKARSGAIDMVIHNGDVGYADGYMHHWDMFMRKISPAFAAYVPYMTTVGNHELYANFTAYKTRLAKSMPKDANTLEGAMYYSLNIGPTRILMMDSETFIDTANIPEEEVAWAQAALSSQDRKTQPWSLVFHHRPLYCNQHSFDCKEFAYLLRLQAEGTYMNNKVDLVSTAHVHYYLRSYPLEMGGATGTSYDNPSSPVYVVNGAAGNREGNKNAGTPDDKYAFGTQSIGYGVLEVASDFANNKHSLTYSFFDSATDAQLDTFTINKNIN